MHILMFCIFGLIVGAIARLVVPGRTPGGWIVSILLGIAGSFVGGYLGQLAGLYGPGEAAGWLMSILGAVVLIVIYDAIVRRRGVAV